MRRGSATRYCGEVGVGMLLLMLLMMRETGGGEKGLRTRGNQVSGE